MSTITGTFKVNGDGNVVIPVGAGHAGTEVEVRVQTRDDPSPLERMTDDEWRRRLADTAGSITDPAFQRQNQGYFEHRLEFD
jgi:hypothetical protein